MTITDYKSSDVRDPAKARQRARDSLQLQIYAMGYEAMTGRLPDAVALHFLESGLVGKVDVDPKRLAKAQDQDRDGRRRHPGPGLRAEARLPRLHVLRVPRHLPGERRAIGPGRRADEPSPHRDASDQPSPTRPRSRLVSASEDGIVVKAAAIDSRRIARERASDDGRCRPRARSPRDGSRDWRG